MKKEKFCILAMICSAVVLLSGCVQINSSDSASMNIHPQTIPPTDDYRPLYQIDSTKKVSAESNVKCLFWVFTWGSDNAFADNASFFENSPMLYVMSKIFPFLAAKETAARAAFYKACKNANCDSIIAARYEITLEDYFIYKKMNVQVQGFPAKLTGVETVKPFPFYVDGKGTVVLLEKCVKPYLVFDARMNLGARRYSLTNLLEDASASSVSAVNR